MRKIAGLVFLFTFLFSLFFFTAVRPVCADEPQDFITYDIRVRLDHKERMLHGQETIQWTNHTQDEVPDMWFHLYWNAFKNEEAARNMEAIEQGYGNGRFYHDLEDEGLGWIDVKNIQPISGDMEFMAADDPPRPGDQTVMRVLFKQPLKPGETVTLTLDFEAKIPKTIRRSGYYDDGYFIAQWFPKPGVYEEGKGWNCHQYHWDSEFFADFAQFTVHITVPQEFVLGASGKEIAKKEDAQAGTVTYTYFQKHIHDFAWTADPDYIKVERDFIADKEVSQQEYLDLSRRLQLPIDDIKLKDVKMTLLINPEHKDQIDRHFKALRMALKYYGLWYGAYPFETETLVDPPYRSGCGGMEYPTLSTAGTSLFPPSGPLVPEFVTIHEFGHNFWYGLCANNEFEEAWLDEGINSYSDGKVIGAAYGQWFIPLFFQGIPYERYTKSLTLDKYYLDRIQALFALEKDPVFTNSWGFYSSADYGLNVYSRAAINLYTLERILGEDVMLRIMRTFHMKFRYKHPKTQDFIDVVNDVSGRDMSWYFRQMLGGTDVFDYGVASVRSVKLKTPRGIYDKNGKKVKVTSETADKEDNEQKNTQYLSIVKVRRYGEAVLDGDVKLKVKVVFEDGTEQVKFWDGKSRWTEYRFTTTSQIKYAQVDPDTVFLIDTNITNNSRKREADGTGACRWGNKVLFWLQNLLQVFSTLG